MPRSVEIDQHSGFCGGVIKAIDCAEDFLSRSGRLYSLGAIVHNEEELDRLGSKGLVCIDSEDLEQTENAPTASRRRPTSGRPKPVSRL